MAASKLVIVESPAKAQTIEGYLGPDYHVTASIGHIRDLPQPKELPETMKKGPYGRFAVNVEDGFKPYYMVNPDKKKKVTELRRLLKEADELYLATDEDREGEAIAWHLLQVLKPKVPVRRMVFHEITKEAIQRALDNTRDLDTDLVDAQETRRILDRLYGYEVSPLLWRKIRPSLSAGRVQSVATRLVVDRERDRMAHVSAEYWSINTAFTCAGQAFSARVASVDGAAIATGSDFSEKGGLSAKAVKAGVLHLDEATARSYAQALTDAPASVVDSVTRKPYRRRPAAPFTTSTLQQEASRKLHWNASSTMRTAQSLYESGYITYMRTDSTALSGQAIHAAREQATQLYGAEAVADAPRTYGTASKGAQEAHEAIRPAGDHFRTPAQVSGELTGAQFRLYELIWKRTVASQMADAVGSTATVTVEVPLTPAAGESRDSGPTFSTAGLTASGTVITFRGFLAAYEEGRDAERYQEDSGASAKDSKDARLPAMITGQELAALAAEASGHETTPPPRYTEASLVKALEEREIGRPSTYAATMSTISDRGYVDHRGQALVPTWLAFAVTRLLEENFTELVDYDFTASMERDLDRIAAGEEDRVAWLRRFYNGQGASGAAAEDAAPTAGELDAAAALRAQGLKGLVDNLGEIDARAVNSIEIGEGITLRVGRYGPYLEDGEGKRANVPADVAPDELTVDKARELFARAADDGRELGVDPVSGHVIIAKDGRYGPYVTEVLPDPEEVAGTAATDSATADGQSATKPAKTATSTKTRRTAKAAKPKPRTASLLRSMDLSTVTLEQALDLLSLPRVVGQDPESGADITAQNGRYGPYLKKGTDSRSLETEEQIFTVTLEQALEIFAQPKRRRGQAAARGPLRELGEDPATGKPVVIKDGRFGPYFTDGETNVTLRRGDDPATVTPERAFELLAEKRAKGPAKKRTTRKTTAKKTTAKKAAAKTATSGTAASKEA